MDEAQKKLVVLNVDLARHIALDYWRRSRQEMEKDEVVTIAYQGLVTAALRFDPTHVSIRKEDLEPTPTHPSGRAFVGFARQRIVGSIMDWQRSRDHVPRRQRRTYKDLQELGHGNGRSVEELAGLTGMDPEKIRAITQAVETTSISLDSPPEQWAELASGVDLPAHSDVEGETIVSAAQQALVDAIDDLPELQRSVIFLRYYAGLEFSHIAIQLGTRLTEVRSAHTEAIYLIHRVLKRSVS